MAERRPLVLVGGELKELPAGDSLPGGSPANVGPDYTEKSATTLFLTSSSPTYQFFTGPTAGQVASLPAAADCAEGKTFYIWNKEGASIVFSTEFYSATLLAYQAVKIVRGFLSDGTTPAWIFEPIISEFFTYLEVDRILAYSTVDDDPPLYVVPMDTPNEAAFNDGSVWFTGTTLKAKVGGVVYDLLSGGSAAPAVSEVEVDFGGTPVSAGAFVVVDPAVSPTSRIVVSQSGNAPTGKDAEENEWDVLFPRAKAGTGQFTLWVDCLSGTVTGKFKFNYTVGG